LYIWLVAEINIGCFRRGPQNHGITFKILMLFHDFHVRPWFVKVHYS